MKTISFIPHPRRKEINSFVVHRFSITHLFTCENIWEKKSIYESKENQ